MQLRELAEYLPINIDEALEERFMESEKLYICFLRKLLVSEEFNTLKRCVQEAAWGEALRLAHNLKGVCANLGLWQLSEDFAAIVKLLRSENYTAEAVKQKLHFAEAEWTKTLHYIGALTV